jgi:hypothetical protein
MVVLSNLCALTFIICYYFLCNKTFLYVGRMYTVVLPVGLLAYRYVRTVLDGQVICDSFDLT